MIFENASFRTLATCLGTPTSPPALRKMELATCYCFRDIDWNSRETNREGWQLRRISRVTKNPYLMTVLYEIISIQQEDELGRPKTGQSESDAKQRRSQELQRAVFKAAYLCQRHANTPLGGNVYRAFMTACKRANSRGSDTEIQRCRK